MAIDERVDRTIKETCEETSERREINFLEMGAERDHVHFLAQSTPTYSPIKIVRTMTGGT
jgi:REP element-mobilizing transposase RayT